jgi:methionine-S-sulfoxide reductase
MKNIATFAAGCFWGVESIIKKIPGVIETRVGYTGGTVKDPTYEMVKKGDTGHAEAVRIVFDPQKITYQELLKYFFRLHDPTTLNRQQNDIGSQYRSAIFYHDEEQKKLALKVIEEVELSKFWQNKILTQLEPAAVFYDAEEYHQNYLDKNPGGYNCHYLR